MTANELPWTNERGHYACEPVPLGTGGYAVAFRAVHKPTGRTAVLKRLLDQWSDEAHGRMQREVDVMSRLAGDPHLMPVLAAGEDRKWYVMPEAEGSLTKLASSVSSNRAQRDLVVDVAQGLAAAHSEGYVHRDVTPGNVLRMSGQTPRWVLADFGLVRRPSGETTTHYTGTGSHFGTFGYVAPELLQDPHREASEKSDVFALARVLQFAATRQLPLPGATEVPETAGVFRRAIRAATDPSPKRRSDLTDFVERVVAACEDLDGPRAPLEDLAKSASTGDQAAAVQLYEQAADHPEDEVLYLDWIPGVNAQTAIALAASLPRESVVIARQLRVHMVENFGSRDFDYLNVPLRWMENVARGADAAENWALLEDIAEILFETDVSMHRFRQRDRTRDWLTSLKGRGAETVARVLRDNQPAIEFYREGGWTPGRTADPKLQGVLN